MADHAGLANRNEEPAHPRGCPHTGYPKAKPCAQHLAKEKPLSPKEGAAAAPRNKPGRQTRIAPFSHDGAESNGGWWVGASPAVLL